ncbi:MAG TPA: tRNA (adenosine(37)-N6)-dimethylallyltransferase MiaA [Gemmatimonadota bacterium]|jgi:tRNA dimethylallyltransferase|nr:tRNA (adenosine(37)-N6)-dimethylallyltransferase MiaA [Gemmatimonadota bacterium]
MGEIHEPYLVIGGATAVGKSEIALEVAERLGGEIVVADSRQVYRGLDVGTAKPGPDERRRAPHHLLDVVDLGERYTAGDYAQDARAAIAAIQGRGRTAVVCGGTGFYLSALAGALDPIEAVADPERRTTARRRTAEIPDSARHAALLEIDPPTARRLPAGDRQRVDRALEVYFLTGRPLSTLQTGGERRLPHLPLAIVRPRVELCARIERRLEAMLGAGLEAEARALHEAGFRPGDPGIDSIGTREWWPYFEGKRGRTETIAEIETSTRAYARRQATWFRHQGGYRPAAPAAEAILEAWRRYREGAEA